MDSSTVVKSWLPEEDWCSVLCIKNVERNGSRSVTQCRLLQSFCLPTSATAACKLQLADKRTQCRPDASYLWEFHTWNLVETPVSATMVPVASFRRPKQMTAICLQIANPWPSASESSWPSSVTMQHSCLMLAKSWNRFLSRSQLSRPSRLRGLVVSFRDYDNCGPYPASSSFAFAYECCTTHRVETTLLNGELLILVYNDV